MKVDVHRTFFTVLRQALICVGIIVSFLLATPHPPLLYAEPLISLNIENADLVSTLKEMADLAGLNVIITDDVRGTVTLRLKDVSVKDAFEVLLKITGLTQVQTGSVVGILPGARLLEQLSQEAETRALDHGAFRVEVVRLEYARARELAPILATLLTPWGTVAVDNRTNSLLIRDVPESSIFGQIQSGSMNRDP
jgi:type IV pilus assembly protein PilQ